MLKWIRSYRNYSRHQDWLNTHFEGDYIRARAGDSILTHIVDMLEGIGPDSAEFPRRATKAIAALTRPDAAWGKVVAFRDSHKTFDYEVPARFITVEAVHQQARYIREVRTSK